MQREKPVSHSRPAYVIVLALVTMVAAGCGAGALQGATPSGALPSAPASTAPTSPAPATPAGTATAGATEVPASPPQVFAAAPGGTAVPGDQGPFSWDGMVSDSPWVLGSAALDAGIADALDITVAGGLETRQWTSVWARVSGGSAVVDAPEGEESGTGLPITVRPPGAGSWSLQVEVWSGDAGHATWYWRVQVGG
jgi:hypothetical protein